MAAMGSGPGAVRALPVPIVSENLGYYTRGLDAQSRDSLLPGIAKGPLAVISCPGRVEVAACAPPRPRPLPRPLVPSLGPREPNASCRLSEEQNQIDRLI